MTEQRVHIEPNERVTFRIHRDDDQVLVVEKNAGVVSTPGIGHEHDTLLNGLMAAYGPRLRQLGAARDHGMLHRLDRETSGLLLVALTPTAYDTLRAGFEARRIKKFYWALTHKAPREHEGVIRRSLTDHVRRTSRYTSVRTSRVGKNGKPALTAYRVLGESALAALIEARPVTGRLHQVRVHLASIGAAVLGDDQYGPNIVRDAAPRLALHAHRLAFEHPGTGEMIDVRTRFPKDLRGTLRKMHLDRPDAEASPS